jgi:hypothetical protein
MKRIAVAVVLASGLAGCELPMTDHPGVSADIKRQEVVQCEFEAEKAAASIANGAEQGRAEYNLKQRCLAAKGWVR